MLSSSGRKGLTAERIYLVNGEWEHALRKCQRKQGLRVKSLLSVFWLSCNSNTLSGCLLGRVCMKEFIIACWRSLWKVYLPCPTISLRGMAKSSCCFLSRSCVLVYVTPPDQFYKCIILLRSNLFSPLLSFLGSVRFDTKISWTNLDREIIFKHYTFECSKQS